MLNSNIDRNIKRYLSKVGILTRNSKYYNSLYYTISWPYTSIKLVIRFSDHFHSKTQEDALEIIANNGFYIIKDNTTKVSVTLNGDSVVKYLSSYLVVYPTIRETINNHIVAAKKAADDLNKISAPYGNAKVRVKELEKEVEELSLEIINTNKKYNKVKNKLTEIKTSLNSLDKL